MQGLFNDGRRHKISAYVIGPPRVEEGLVPPHGVVPLPRPALLWMAVRHPRFEKPEVLLPDRLMGLGPPSLIFLLLVLLFHVILVWGSTAFVPANEQ